MIKKFTHYYKGDKRWLLATSARAKVAAKNAENITDAESNAWKEWDTVGEYLYAEALDEIERLESVIEKIREETK